MANFRAIFIDLGPLGAMWRHGSGQTDGRETEQSAVSGRRKRMAPEQPGSDTGREYCPWSDGESVYGGRNGGYSARP